MRTTGTTIIVAAAGLILAGCSSTDDQSIQPTPERAASSSTQASELNHAYNPKVGGRDAQRLSESLNGIDGVNMTPDRADDLARNLCRMYAEGASPREGADWVVKIGGPYWGEQNARVAALHMTLEFCPETVKD